MKRRYGDESELARQLASDHAHLEQLFGAVTAGLRGGEPDSLRARWLELDHALECHLTTEEELILPGFAQAFPSSAARLRQEHHDIRAALVQLGVDLDLHELSSASAARLIRALRMHAHYEDDVLYPWAEQHLTELERPPLLARLRHLQGSHAPKGGERS